MIAQRRAFRRIPAERLSLEDYYSADPASADSTYLQQAALIEGYEFDRLRFRVSASTFRSVDLAQWLALDIAAQALADAGFAEGGNLPTDTTGVLVGNSLTGEFSRAGLMRLRWPFVRRAAEHALTEEGLSHRQRDSILEKLQETYLKPFAPTTEESLAGGLSNVIAGRICNHFNLRGGGYTLDGACASSLLAVISASSALMSGELDVALAGGVDLSLDPFELVGFSRVGAFSQGEMRVFDRHSDGFLPGEGCGFVVLQRAEDAVQQGRRIYAVVRGWGISSDGAGGITRPEAEGQLLALQRAYRQAGFGIDTVSFFEGHGTGTKVGDLAELQALAAARRADCGLRIANCELKTQSGPSSTPNPQSAIRNSQSPSACIGSVKANIGHTKAAAGVAGLIKAVMALDRQVLPPTTGCPTPHEELASPNAPAILQEPVLWPADRPLRAAVSSMGFGGINTHIVIEGTATARRAALDDEERQLAATHQDAELFLLSAPNRDDLLEQVERVLRIVPRISRAELTDLAAELARTVVPGQARAAIVAGTPEELTNRLEIVRSALRNGEADKIDVGSGVFIGEQVRSRITFLFPGQGGAVQTGDGALTRRFGFLKSLHASSPHNGEQSFSGAVIQPATALNCLAGLRVLAHLGVEARWAAGHSLGELVALHWAGAIDEETLLRIAHGRGQAMDRHARQGAMAVIGAGAAQVRELLNGSPAVVACMNSPSQTVVSGEAPAVDELMVRARARGMSVSTLQTTHAFHSPLVSDVVPVLGEQLSTQTFGPLQKTVVSTVTATPLNAEADLRELLCKQVVSPVRFSEAVERLIPQTDLFIEVGAGQVLTRLLSEVSSAPAVALEVGGPSLLGLLQAVGAAFALGLPVHVDRLFAGRFTRPFDLDRPLKFFANPCELAPRAQATQSEQNETGRGNGKFSTRNGQRGTRNRKNGRALVAEYRTRTGQQRVANNPRSAIRGSTELAEVNPQSSSSPVAIEVMKQVLEERLELPAHTLKPGDHLLRDLHLNSLSIGQIVAESARRMGLPRPASPTEYSQATLGEVATTLDELRRTGQTAGADSDDTSGRFPAGVDSWVRSFTVELKERPADIANCGLRIADLTSTNINQQPGTWRVIGLSDDPLTDSLKTAFAHAGIVNCGFTDTFDNPQFSGGVMVCLPPEPDESSISLLLEGAKDVLNRSGSPTFVLVQRGGGGAAFARSLCLEAPHVRTCVVDLPPGHADATKWILAEALSAQTAQTRHYYREAHYDAAGRRYEPVLRLLPQQGEPRALPLDRSDVMLVTGGGKGIAAECSLSLARDSGMSLAILGRSSPQTDVELAANLDRLTAAGIRFTYVQADVTDERALRAAIAAATQKLGPITAVLHGAGANSPQPIRSLDEDAVRRTLAPKFHGLQNVLAAVDAGRLRVLITFGSLISRAGFRGEADYALANEWVSRLTEQFQVQHPRCRCLCVEWSIWSGVGMGERLGRVGALLEEGITPITPDQGVSILRRLLCENVPPSVVVSGRFGEPPTLRLEEPPLPRQRFLEEKKVYYPGVELVVDSHLSSQSDLYIDDHVYGADRLFPAVMGLEAMAQAAAALVGSDPATARFAGTSRLPAFEKVEFLQPVTVPEGQTTTLRLAALVREPDRVEVVLRTSQTEFQVDHFRATCRFSEPGPRQLVAARAAASCRGPGEHLPLSPAQDLYGEHLFQTGRFQRIEGYRRLSARECAADLAGADSDNWFAPDLPRERLLGDPGVRDAALHAIQACIPHKVVLPVSVEHINIFQPARGPCSMYAIERARRGDTFIYDLDLLDADGHIVESWQGLQLKATQPVRKSKPWPVPLLRPLLERELSRIFGDRAIDVVIGQVSGRECERAVALKQELHSAAGSASRTTASEHEGPQSGPYVKSHRPDGKPEGANGSRAVSFTYGGGLLLGVSGERVLGCDLEAVVARPARDWAAVLGPSGCSLAEQVSDLNDEDYDTAATRVWTVLESVKKAGLPPDTPLTIRERPTAHTAPPGSIEPLLLSAGAARAATYALPVEGCADPLVVTVLSAPRLSGPKAARKAGLNGQKAYEYRHVVTFEDTNLLGNVYYVNYLSWQGRCRELFLREHAPDILTQLRKDLRLVTVGVSCRFTVEVAAFDELLIRMTLKARKGNRLKLGFEYLRLSENGQLIPVAKGIQVVASMRREGDHLVPTPIPKTLLEALEPFAGPGVWKD